VVGHSIRGLPDEKWDAGSGSRGDEHSKDHLADRFPLVNPVDKSIATTSRSEGSTRKGPKSRTWCVLECDTDRIQGNDPAKLSRF